MTPIVPVDGYPLVDAVVAALKAALPAYFVGDAEDANVPEQSCPALIVYGDPGTVSGGPYAPGRDLLQTLTLIGVGLTRTQAQRAAEDGRRVVLSGAVTVAGRRVVITPSDTQQPNPQRDRETSALFTQAVILNVRN